MSIKVQKQFDCITAYGHLIDRQFQRIFLYCSFNVSGVSGKKKKKFGCNTTLWLIFIKIK